MKYMMDTNICIYAVGNKSESAIRKILSQDPEDLCISVAAYAELMHGVEKNQAVGKNHITMLLSPSAVTVLDFDGEAAEAYGQIRTEPERKGTPIDLMDLLIAGHARSQDLVLVTNNTRESAHVTGLQVEDWI